MNCYCDLNKIFSQCCEPIIIGTRNAQTAEELMRSRYSAFCILNMAHLHKTTDPQSLANFDSAANEKWARSVKFTRLEVLRSEENNMSAVVEFKAHYTSSQKNLIHHEISTFRKHKDHWYYKTGKIINCSL